MLLPTIHIERWKYNKTYNIYVSSYGRFKSKNHEPIKVLTNSSGYLAVVIDKKPYSAHRIVLETFKPCDNMTTLTVDHLDHNHHNNSLHNLEWVSKAENQLRAKQDYLIINPLDTGMLLTNGIQHFSSAEEAAKWLITYKKLLGKKATTSDAQSLIDSLVNKFNNFAIHYNNQRPFLKYYGTTWTLIQA